MTTRSLALFLLVSVSTTSLWAEDAPATPGFDRAVQPFLAAHCLRCHNEKKQNGDFRIDSLSRDVGTGPDVKHWLEVMERITSGEMPPEDEPNRPTAEEGAKVVEWLAERVREGEAARLAKRHPVSFHRLSREEYANTIHDLLGVRYDPTIPGGLNEDEEWHGFERIGSVLSLSASHVEKYIDAAETILAEAYPDKPPEPIHVVKNALDLRGGPSPSMIADLEARGLLDKVRVDMWPGHRIQGGRPGPGRNIPAGEYRVRVKLSGLKPVGGRAPHLTFYADKLDRMLFEQDVLAPEGEPTVVEFTTHLPEGNHTFQVMNDVPGPSILPRSGRSGRKPFISLADGRIPWQLKLTDEEGRPLYPFLIVDSIEWEGPLLDEATFAKRARFMPTDEKDPAELAACLRRFVELAFRRPAREGEVEKYVALVNGEVAAGEPFRAAVKTGLLAVLCSKDFLYLVEGKPELPAEENQTLDDWQLASRLSYLLWSSMPDDELLDLARAGRLHEPDVLDAQFTRMLADPRAEAFAETFPKQWLQLHKVGMFPPDKRLYPNYDDYLEKSSICETTAFFGEVLKQNLSLREFLVSDWTMLNPRLAMHYGIEDVDEDRFQRVSLKPEDHRGGVLTHASILSLTSDGTRHRPVHRGVWVLESILGRTPPPPPANVEPIEPNPVDAPKATIRMKLDAHKVNPNCAACHRKIDPLGFAFENYDAIGRWRETERVQQGQGSDPMVDPSGTMPDGRAFENAHQFQRLLLDDMDAFNATFVEKLATYTLRRTMTVDDRTDLAAIAAASKAADYKLRDTVRALVLSDLFRKR